MGVRGVRISIQLIGDADPRLYALRLVDPRLAVALDAHVALLVADDRVLVALDVHSQHDFS